MEIVLIIAIGTIVAAVFCFSDATAELAAKYHDYDYDYDYYWDQVDNQVDKWV